MIEITKTQFTIIIIIYIILLIDFIRSKVRRISINRKKQLQMELHELSESKLVNFVEDLIKESEKHIKESTLMLLCLHNNCYVLINKFSKSFTIYSKDRKEFALKDFHDNILR